jgi:hypothetical protein
MFVAFVLAPRLPRHLSSVGTVLGWSTKACNLLVGVHTLHNFPLLLSFTKHKEREVD